MHYILEQVNKPDVIFLPNFMRLISTCKELKYSSSYLIQQLRELHHSFDINMIPTIDEYVCLNNKFAQYLRSGFALTKGYKAPLFTVAASNLSTEVYILPKTRNEDIITYFDTVLSDETKADLHIVKDRYVTKYFYGECGLDVQELTKSQVQSRKFKEAFSKGELYTGNCMIAEPYCPLLLREHRFYVVGGKVLYCSFSAHSKQKDGIFNHMTVLLNSDELIVDDPGEVEASPYPFAKVRRKDRRLRNIVERAILHIYNNHVTNDTNCVSSKLFFLRIDVSISLFSEEKLILILKEVEPLSSAFFLLADEVGEVETSNVSKVVDIIENLSQMYKNILFQNVALVKKLATPSVRLIKQRTKDEKDLLIKRRTNEFTIV